MALLLSVSVALSRADIVTSRKLHQLKRPADAIHTELEQDSEFSDDYPVPKLGRRQLAHGKNKGSRVSKGDRYRLARSSASSKARSSKEDASSKARSSKEDASSKARSSKDSNSFVEETASSEVSSMDGNNFVDETAWMPSMDGNGFVEETASSGMTSMDFPDEVSKTDSMKEHPCIVLANYKM
jgi:hypothetical protein